MTHSPETTCPECSGAGFYGDNGPVVESLCGFCRGTGVLIEDSAYQHPEQEKIPRKPMARSWTCPSCRWMNSGLWANCRKCSRRKVA